MAAKVAAKKVTKKRVKKNMTIRLPHSGIS